MYRGRAESAGADLFQARAASGERRVFSAAALTGRDVYVVLSAPSPGLWSWAALNPIGNLLLPLGAWLTAFAAVMLVSERVDQVYHHHALLRPQRPLDASQLASLLQDLQHSGRLGELVSRYHLRTAGETVAEHADPMPR